MYDEQQLAMKSGKKTATVMVEKIVTGGAGLARLADGRVVFIPGTLPEETVRISFIDTGKTHLFATLSAVLEPNNHRISPPCPAYGQCGGCDFQHVEYAFQVAIKEQILRDQFVRSGMVSEDQFAVVSATAMQSENSFGYRQRIRLQIDEITHALGYFKTASHRVYPVDQCLLAVPPINTVLGRFAADADFFRKCPSVRECELLYSETDDRLLIIFHCRQKPKSAESTRMQDMLSRYPEVKAVMVEVEGYGRHLVITPAGCQAGSHLPLDDSFMVGCRIPASGPNHEDSSLELQIEPGGFCQVNQAQNRNIIQILLDLTRDRRFARLIDFHCGVGNFLLPLAGRTHAALGIDLKRAAIRSAEKNARAAGHSAHCRFEQSSAALIAHRLADQKECFDLILLDPPRQGCSDLTAYLSALSSGLVVYISCDPATLVRDLATLIRQGFRITRVQLIDMFPQTHHIETMVLLEREDVAG